MQSAVFLPFDGDNVLRATGLADITTATNTDSQVMPFIEDGGAYWQTGAKHVAFSEQYIAIEVAKIGSGDAALSFEIVASDDAFKTNVASVAAFPAVVGAMTIPVDAYALKQAQPTYKYWFLRAVTTVGTGAIDASYSAYLSPDID